MSWLEKLWDFITNIVPVERWIRAIANALKFLSLAFILTFLLVIVFVMKDWGFSATQRFWLIVVTLSLLFLVLLASVILALLPGGLLYSPYERSLASGDHYRTDTQPRNRRDFLKAEAPPPLPGLTQPTNPKRKLPPPESRR